MTPNQINQAIAEHCGWQFLPERDTYAGPQPETWEDFDGERHFSDATYPNYHGDLNAMHEAEKTLNGILVECFGENLAVVVIGEELNSLNYLEVSTVASATSAQRAEAFVRTIGKWEE